MFRRYIGSAAGSNLGNRGDTRAATRALTQLDDFVQDLGPDDVDAGDIEALQEALPKAREIWSRMSRSQLVDDAIDNSENYLSGQASGLRNQFKRIVSSEKLRRGFSEDEIKAMRRVANGTLPVQVLNYLGSGLGMMMQAGAGGVAGGLPEALGGAATGMASRKGAEAITRRNADLARALIASSENTLPVASDRSRGIAEALLRRTTATGPR